jgi:hypothetical protein
MPTEKSDLLQGTLDMLILKIVTLGPVHGYGISLRIWQISKDVLRVQQGSLYPALHRLEDGWNPTGANLTTADRLSFTDCLRRDAGRWEKKNRIGIASPGPFPKFLRRCHSRELSKRIGGNHFFINALSTAHWIPSFTSTLRS